jgi:hypothetical protein
MAALVTEQGNEDDDERRGAETAHEPGANSEVVDYFQWITPR